MATIKFPYSNNQVLISAGGVLLHSKDDTIMLFGKKGVGISSPTEFHVDALNKTVINSKKIELGLRAETEGEPVLKGTTTLDQLVCLIDDLQSLGDALSKIAVENLPAAVPGIQQTAGSLRDTAIRVKGILLQRARSEVTYTK